MGSKKKVKPLSRYIRRSLKQYFDDLNGTDPSGLHVQMTQELERHLFDYVLKHTNGNRSRAAAILGMSRSTLRKKLTQYELAAVESRTLTTNRER
ncbi:MAG: Fis family transcriptional regulator [Acidiferrobacterales bacterium]|nr:Fis family transcriptional regulator [Acidiferrobacterales bacterium]